MVSFKRSMYTNNSCDASNSISFVYTELFNYVLVDGFNQN